MSLDQDRDTTTQLRPAVRYDTDRDPREDESWFCELPEAEQQRLRQSWHGQRHRHDGQTTELFGRLLRALWQGALLFLVVGVLGAPLAGLGPVPLMIVAGAIAAVLGEACGGGRFAYGAAGGAAYLIVIGPTLLFSPFGLVMVLMASFGLAALGMQNEMERSGGFTQRK